MEMSEKPWPPVVETDSATGITIIRAWAGGTSHPVIGLLVDARHKAEMKIRDRRQRIAEDEEAIAHAEEDLRLINEAVQKLGYIIENEPPATEASDV